MKNKLECKVTLESEGYKDKKSAKLEKKRIEILNSIKEVYREIELSSTSAMSLKKEVDSMKISLEQQELKNQELSDRKKLLTDKLERLENSLESQNEILESLEPSYSSIEQNSSLPKVNKSAEKKRFKTSKQTQINRVLPEQIDTLKGIVEDQKLNIGLLRQSIEKCKNQDAGLEEIIQKLEQKKGMYGNEHTEIISDKEDFVSDCFVKSEQISIESLEKKPVRPVRRVAHTKSQSRVEKIGRISSTLCLKFF